VAGVVLQHQAGVAAAYLARAGLSIKVLARNPVAGGAVVSEELTEPGYIRDTFSGWHAVFRLSAAYAEPGEELDFATANSPTPGRPRTSGRTAR
jgi:phytoene dehydrogenase-like protein